MSGRYTARDTALVSRGSENNCKFLAACTQKPSLLPLAGDGHTELLPFMEDQLRLLRHLNAQVQVAKRKWNNVFSFEIVCTSSKCIHEASSKTARDAKYPIFGRS
jgi:hypothetical protein